MRYASLKLNDTANCPGIAVSLYVQGCPAPNCPKCHNPETWAFDGGKEFTIETLNQIIQGLTANGVQRNFCLLGGEPLCPDNEFLSHMVLLEIRKQLPNTKIYIWTKYLYENLKQQTGRIQSILEIADYLIDGPYINSQRDITLAMKGSKNQRVWDLKTKKVIG